MAISETLTFIALVGSVPTAATAGTLQWPDTPVKRLEIFAQLQTLNADLLSHNSATVTLERWCARHKLAVTGKIVADRVSGEDKQAPAKVRSLLRVNSDQLIVYRRVKLRCGNQVLSEADNWYVPSRLTPEMNRVLATRDTAFGRVVQPLRFQRHTRSARLLWSPLPDGWDTGEARWPKTNANVAISIPHQVIEHRALLTRSDGIPFSYVVETYTDAVIDFTPSPDL